MASYLLGGWISSAVGLRGAFIVGFALGLAFGCAGSVVLRSYLFMAQVAFVVAALGSLWVI